MRTKRFMIGLLIGSITLVMIGSPALAGNVQRTRWEGVAIGVAATLLGQALLDHHRTAYAQPAPVPAKGYRHHDHQVSTPPGNGRTIARHRNFQKVWVPPVYKKIWNPAHYDRQGRWVPWHWIQTQIAPGYWTKQRIASAYPPGRAVR